MVLIALLSALAGDQASSREHESREALSTLRSTIEISIGNVGNLIDGTLKTIPEILASTTEALTKYVDSTYLVITEAEKADFDTTAKIFRFAAKKDKDLGNYTGIPTTEQMQKAEYDIFVRTISNGFAPKDSEFVPSTWEWFGWEYHLGAFAMTHCLDGTIKMNIAYDPRVKGVQYRLSKDNYYPGTLATWAHEAQHQFGKVCKPYLIGAGSIFQYTSLVDNGIERTAQAGALEVLASMANEGDIDAFFAFTHLRREITLRAMIYAAMTEDRGEEALIVMREVGEDPFQIAIAERMLKDAKKYPMFKAEIKLGLEQYGHGVLLAIMDAAKHPDHETKKLLRLSSRDQKLHYATHTLDDIFFLMEHEDEFIDYVKSLKPLS